MGKKSRRTRAPRERKEPVPVEDAYAQPLVRYRPADHFHVDDNDMNSLTQELYYAAKAAGADDLGLTREEKQVVTEFIHLVVFPAHKKSGLEAGLRLVRRWPRIRPHWHRVRRRICDYCGRRNDLSEPRLWVCAGCGVARYCDEGCQAADFSHHAKRCIVLARRWDGVGPIPTQLFDLPDCWVPAVVPSERARERIQDWIREKTTVTRELYK